MRYQRLTRVGGGQRAEAQSRVNLLSRCCTHNSFATTNCADYFIRMSEKLRDLFMKHREVMLHLEVQDARGDYGSGSAFHVDDGATRYIAISCQDSLLQKMVATAVLDKVPTATPLPNEPSGVRIGIPRPDALAAATHVADALITEAGLQASGNNTALKNSSSTQTRV